MELDHTLLHRPARGIDHRVIAGPRLVLPREDLSSSPRSASKGSQHNMRIVHDRQAIVPLEARRRRQRAYPRSPRTSDRGRAESYEDSFQAPL